MAFARDEVMCGLRLRASYDLTGYFVARGHQPNAAWFLGCCELAERSSKPHLPQESLTHCRMRKVEHSPALLLDQGGGKRPRSQLTNSTDADTASRRAGRLIIGGSARCRFKSLGKQLIDRFKNAV